MAIDQGVIASYLIKLGYSVDKAQQAAFNAATEKSEKSAKNIAQSLSKVGSGFIATFATIAGLGTAAAVSMDKLYIASRRAGTDPLVFRSYTEGFRQIGGQAEEMSATLQSIGTALRDSPAARVFSEGLVGKPTTNAVETLEGLLTFYEKLVRENPNGSDVLARNLVNTFASQLGADPDTIRQILLDPEGFRRGIRERSQAAKSAGLKSEDVKAAYELTNKFKAGLDDLYLGLMKVSVSAFPAINQKLAEFDKWFRENPNGVSDAIDLIGDSFKRTGEIIAGVAGTVGPFFDFLKWLDDHGLLGIVTGAAIGARGGVVGAVAGAAIGGVIEHGNFGSDRPAPPIVQYGEGRFSRTTARPDDPGLLSKFQSALGITRDQAAAIVGNLEAESRLNPAAYNPAGGGRGAQGIAQWRGDRLAGAEAFLGGPVRSASLDRQADYVIRELLGSESGALAELRRAQGLSAQVTAFRRSYERPGEAEANDAARLLYAQRALGSNLATGGPPLRSAGNAPAFQSKIEINVNATNAPSREIGTAVKLSTERVMQDAIRNFSAQNTAP